MIINTEMPRMFLYNTEPLYQGENDDEKILLVISLYDKGKYFIPMNIIVSSESINARIIQSPCIIMIWISFIVYLRNLDCNKFIVIGDIAFIY